jgi:hypothetical protein
VAFCKDVSANIGKAANKAPEPTTFAVTSRATARFNEGKARTCRTYYCTSRASEGRGSSLTLGKMKTIALSFFVLAVGVAYTGCSFRVWIRLFNRSEHAITVLTSEGETAITPGANATVEPWLESYNGVRGFVLSVGGKQYFYSLITAGAGASRISVALPSESAHWSRDGKEYVIEFGPDNELFALVPRSTGSLTRLSPQPPGFPVKPNKAPEPTPGAVTPRATEGASK